MAEFRFSPRPNAAADIRWRPWGTSAFAEAAAADRPVLLAISAVWCHWCHVMDETTYSDRRVIGAINEAFVPIRVDNDRRPDVNARYNQGGWPTTAILTPEGELLAGATYVPPEQMVAWLSRVADFYADTSNRLELRARIEESRTRRAAATLPAAGELDPQVALDVAAAAADAFDDVHGGFGSDQKFPHVPLLHHLLDVCARRPDERAQTMVVRSLHAMADGGMYDHVDGGFYRYSTTPDFSVPHFEKMLEDLGGELLACARAAAMFGDRRLGAVAVDVRRYMDERLWNAGAGAYGGSQDADEAYYALGAEGRAARPEPYVDPTIYTSWNAQGALALIVSAPLLATAGTLGPSQADGWIERGVAVLETLWSRLLADGMMCRFLDASGLPAERGLLGDQAWSALGALSAAEATGDARWIDRACALFRASNALFDPQALAFADRPFEQPGPGRLRDRAYPLEENALLARAMLAGSAATGDLELGARARAVLQSFAASARAHGIFAASYASAVLDVLEPPLDVRIVGPAADPACRALRRAALEAPSPPIRIANLDPARDGARLAALGQDAGPRPAAFVCDSTVCFARACTPDELTHALSQRR